MSVCLSHMFSWPFCKHLNNYRYLVHFWYVSLHWKLHFWNVSLQWNLQIEFRFRFALLFYTKITCLELELKQNNRFSGFFVNACRYLAEFRFVNLNWWVKNQVNVSFVHLRRFLWKLLVLKRLSKYYVKLWLYIKAKTLYCH